MWFVCTTANRLSSQRKTVRLNVFSSEQISVLHTMQPIAPDSYLYIYIENSPVMYSPGFDLCQPVLAVTSKEITLVFIRSSVLPGQRGTEVQEP